MNDNVLIATFMGLKRDKLMYKDWEQDMYFYKYHTAKLLYDKNWEWLMEVVNKIESLGHAVQIRFDACLISDGENEYWIRHSLPNQTKLQATYKAVVEFIKWYFEDLEEAPCAQPRK